MITEDYCSFEISKLLREKGFDGESHKHYWGYEHGKEFLTEGFFNPEYDYPAPTLQMAMKWLREKFNINPVPYALSLSWAFDIFDLSNRDITGCKKLFSMDLPSKSECYNSYEEACEAAIKYCLENLI